MPYTQTEFRFGRLIQKALEQKEIQDGMQKARLKSERVTSNIEALAEQIWNTADSQIESYNKIEERLNIDRARASSEYVPTPLGLRIINFLVRLLGTAFALLIVGYLVFAPLAGWKEPFAWALRTLGLIGWIGLGASLIATAGLIVIRTGLNRRHERFKAQVVESIEESLGIADTEILLLRAESDISAAIVEGIRREVRAAISKRIHDSFETNLEISEAPGLSEVFDSEYEVDTEAKRKLSFMIETMPGGSIGIAGPRGSGKSTLISSFCGESVTELNGRKVLTLFASAPVEYESRDFLLHLFSSLCHRVLERSNGHYRRAQWKGTDEMQSPPALRLIGFIPTAVILIFLIGAGFTLASLSIADRNLRIKRVSEPQSPSTAVSQPNQNEAATAQAHVSQAPSETKAPPSWLDELGLSPAPLFKWGSILILLSVAVYVSGWSKTRDAFRAELGDRTSWLWDTLTVLDIAGTLKLMRRIHRGIVIRGAHPVASGGAENTDISSELIDEANDWLKEIKFQQSYTSGWSGALKFPIGLEGGLSAAVSMAQKQLSLPEIVAGFTDFLKSISVYFRVIIGIDELDKLESDEKAQQFLDEIKAVFGLNGVFYLVSVSESAMSSFERRGLPFRDVFDSSFDNIVHVNYLKFNTAKNLLGRRVVGMPIPFVALCYCASGGLARDLIRSCRNLIETNGTPEQSKDLKSLSASLIKADLDSKIRAITVSVERINQEPERSELLETLYQLETVPMSPKALFSSYEVLTSLSKELKGKSDREDDDSEAADLKKLAPLAGELAIYAYYLVTLLEFFSRRSLVSGLSELEGLARLELLARARQALATNPAITNSILDGFRKRAHMTVPRHAKQNQIRNGSDGGQNTRRNRVTRSRNSSKTASNPNTLSKDPIES